MSEDGLEKKVAEISKEELRILKKLQRDGMSIKDVQLAINALKKGNPQSKNQNYYVGKSHVKYLLFGDTHIGNINYDPGLMSYAAKEATKQKVDFIVHTGDIMDGWYQNRPQAIFEQNAVGLDNQFKMTVKEFKKLKQPLFFITGNHEYNTFVRGAGIEVGPYLQDKLREEGVQATFLGNAEGDIVLSTGCDIKVMHPDGGSSYAISYKSQKLAESLESGKKPKLLHIGHFHKAEYIFYRNMHIFQTGTLMGQTKFMRGKQIAAHKGFWIIDVYSRKGGQVDKITPSWYPSYS